MDILVHNTNCKTDAKKLADGDSGKKVDSDGLTRRERAQQKLDKAAEGTSGSGGTDFVVTPNGTVMDTSKNYNLVGSGEKGDWFQIHNYGKEHGNLGFPHTHYSRVNANGVYTSVSRLDQQTSTVDIDYANELLETGKMILRKGGR